MSQKEHMHICDRYIFCWWTLSPLYVTHTGRLIKKHWLPNHLIYYNINFQRTKLFISERFSLGFRSTYRLIAIQRKSDSNSRWPDSEPLSEYIHKSTDMIYVQYRWKLSFWKFLTFRLSGLPIRTGICWLKLVCFYSKLHMALLSKLSCKVKIPNFMAFIISAIIAITNEKNFFILDNWLWLFRFLVDFQRNLKWLSKESKIPT